MNKNRKKTIALGVLFLLIAGLLIPYAQGSLRQIQKNPVINNEQADKSTENGTITCYTFGKTGNNKQDIVLSTDEVTRIFERLKELNSERAHSPFSKKTQALTIAFIDLLAEKKILPNQDTKEEYITLLNPKWIQRLQNIEKGFSIPHPFTSRGTCTLCSVGGEGSGILFPLILLPRPRIAALWSGTGLSTATNMFTGKGYIAQGAQTGSTFGFTGIGLSYSLPGYPIYGFIGYALIATTTAEYIEYYPPNRAPEISDIEPGNGEQDIPITLSALQFRIQDADNDRMSYTVTTDPDIGSASGNSKPFGVYTVPISGLQNDKTYRWIIEVTDGKETITKEYSFSTQGRPPFDPFSQGWNYRKEISINHTKVTETLTNFPVLISIIDPDLRDKARDDGDDILFMDNDGIATKLYHEIDSFNGTTGMLTVWVRLPAVSSTADTIVYMYYGNPSSTAQQFPERVWNSHFKAVWHLNSNPTDSILDSTINNNDGTAYGSMSSSSLIDGKVGKCLQFDGINDYLHIPDSAALKPTEVTLLCWLNIDPEYEAEHYILGKRCDDIWGNQDTVSYGMKYYEKYMGTFAEKDDNTHTIAKNTASLGTWYYTAMTFDSTTYNIQYYQNGILCDTVNHGQSLRYAAPSEFIMAAGHIREGSELNYWVNCKIDEVWIVDTNLTPGWVSTIFENQNNPINFLRVGIEEPHP